MASAFTHAFVALVAGGAAGPKRMPLRFWLLAVFCSAAPDLDVITFYFGVDYADFWGHRGFMHSLTFALGLALVVVTVAFPRQAPFLGRRWWGLVLFFFIVTGSHGLIDAFTNGGLGIAFFSPFDTTRYFMPWTPVQVAPIGTTAFFSAWGANAMVSEMFWVWVPVAGLGLGAVLLRRKTR